MATIGFVIGYLALLCAGIWALAASTHTVRFLPLAGVMAQLLALTVWLANSLIKQWHWQLGLAALLALIWVRSRSLGGWLILAGLGLLLESARSAWIPQLALENLLLGLACLLILPVLLWSIHQWRTQGRWSTRGLPPLPRSATAKDAPPAEDETADGSDPLDHTDAQAGADKYMRE